MPSERKKLIINLIVSSSVLIIQLAVSFWLSPFVISRLGESSYGFISLCNNFSEYAALLAISVNSMANRFMSIEYNRGNIENSKKIFSSVFWINIVFSIVILLSSSIIIYNLDKLIEIEPNLVIDVKIAMGITFLNLIISFISTCYIAVPFVTNKMLYTTFTQFFTKLISSLTLVALFIFLSPHVFYVSFSTACASFIGLIIYIFAKHRLLPAFKIKWCYFDIHQILSIAKSGVWMLISNLNSIMLVGLDLLIANILIDSSSMGRLSVSKLIPTFIGRILGSFSNIFTASFTKTYAQDRDNLYNEVTFSLRVLGVVFVVPFAGIIVFGLAFFRLWLPIGIYSASDILQIYILTILTLINTIINAFMYSIHSLIISLNKVKTYSLLILCCSLISVTLTIFLTSHTKLGVYAIAGTSTAVLGFINLIIIPLFAEKASSVKRLAYIKTIIKSHIALIVTILLFILIKPILSLNTWFTFFISIFFISIIGYIFSYMILLSKEERIRIHQSIYSKLKKQS